MTTTNLPTEQRTAIAPRFTYFCQYCKDTGSIRVECGGSYGEDVIEECEDCVWLKSQRQPRSPTLAESRHRIAVEERADKIADDLCGGRPDSASLEALWSEMERVLEIGDETVRRDFIADTTIGDLIERVAKQMAEKAITRTEGETP